MQTQVLMITIVFMLIMAIVFARVVRSVKSEKPLERIETKRRGMIWSMLIVGVIVSLGSLRQWPHSIPTAGSTKSEIVQVNATGAQWYWEIDTTEIPLGKTVVFNVKTTDVNHGFGVIDANGTLLAQTQAMPGYTNKVKYVFDKPGKYRVICMELCGTGHHSMQDEFTVIANTEELGG